MKNIIFNKDISKRTKKFYKAALQRIEEAGYSQYNENFCKAYFDIYHDEPLRRRQALSFAYALKHESVIINSNELLTGQLYIRGKNCPLWGEFSDNDRMLELLHEKESELCELTGDESWITPLHVGYGHIGWHWEWIINDGTEGLLKKIENSYMALDDKGKVFLKGMRICIEAINEWADMHVNALKKRLTQTDDFDEQGRLNERISICSKVPRRGAKHFREAVQAFHFVYSIGMLENPYGGNGPGRLDYHLWPYLKKDLAEGIETEQSSRELIDELFIRIHERLSFENDTSVEAIVVGGSQPDGSSAYNPLSRIIVESISALKMTHPSVYIRMPEKPCEELLELAASYLRDGSNRCQILNDKTIIGALEKKGVSHDDAVMYMCGGCMEISSQGTNGDMLFTNFFNTPKVLELVINGGVCLNTGKKMLKTLNKTLIDYNSFEELYTVFINELTRILHLWFKRIDLCVKFRAELKPSFFISAQIEDCIKRGRGINDGGAKYEDYGATPLAIPNIGDSLFALKKAVYDDAFVSAAELLEALRNNFAGNESLRLRLLHLPKFGQGYKEADVMVDRVLGDICDAFDSYTNVLGGKVRPMIMTFNRAASAGKALGATPDGRKAGTPIAQGLTPQSSSMIHGLSTAMLSANSLSLDRLWGGTTSMWDIDRKFATIENLKAIIQTFLQQGGQIYQGNSTDVEELKRARIEPEKYPHLIVRVGGYSGRFTALSKDLQQEIIDRYRHSA